MECKPNEKMHRFPVATRRCYCGQINVPKPVTDGTENNDFLFRQSTIVRRANEKLAEEEARLRADQIEFNEVLPDAHGRKTHVPGDVGYDPEVFWEQYTLLPEHVEHKDRQLLQDLGLRGHSLDRALGI